MINGLQGIPGSGKSYEACVYHVLAAINQKRKVITNLPLVMEMWAAISPDSLDLIEMRWKVQPVRGTWDADRIDEATGQGDAFELFEDGHVEKSDAKVRRFGHVWDFWSDWKHPKTGKGPLFVIDECHIALPRICDPQVVEYFKLHRHFNADILLMTQNFRDMNQDIAGLLAILIKTRKADVLGKPDHYIRNVHSGYRGALISSEERKYKPEFFGLYKSHTQGNSVGEAEASDVAPFIVKFKRFSRAFYAVTAVVVVWAFWPSSKPSAKAVEKAEVDARLQASYKDYAKWQAAGKPGYDPGPLVGKDGIKALDAQPIPPTASVEKPLAEPAAAAAPQMPEPFAGRGLHLTGRMTMNGKTVYTFTISNNAVYVNTVTDRELVDMGYAWSPIGDCAGALAWRTQVRAVVCDSPRALTATLSS